ncbi:MAG: ATP synthase F1 subunit delta [Acidimicrobiia bacterium]|nr:ATP synthase F1 subunit delta [Acidimicrobiia bacterium]
MSDRIDLYADAFLALIRAEGSGNEVLDELFRISRTIDGNDELRNALSDPRIEAARRTQIVQDLLDGKAHALTISLVGTVVTNGRVRELSSIVDRLLAANAASGGRVVAQVRSAVALSEDQTTRLAAALTKSTGREVEVIVDVDPSVLGGLVTQIGDTVIDGSVRHRLSQLRESF